MPHAANPFATRSTRPGALEFLFPPDLSAAALVERLRSQSWWGAILGPHGVGKSTLLKTLEPALQQAGRSLATFALHAQQRALPLAAAETATWNGQTQVIVDGYEQLGWWSRRKLLRLCRRSGAGLLVTAHEPVDVPELLRLAPSLATLQTVVQRLLADVPADERRISDDDVASAFERQAGNARETLFDLFDLHRRRAPGA